MMFGELSRAIKAGGRSSAQTILKENGKPTNRGLGYQFDDDLIAAVDVAMELGRPLLISGEPGVGKTELGYAIARSLEISNVYLYSVKSNSDASELFYTYDALQRLRDAQLGAGVPSISAPDVGDYIEFQAMGRAILSAHRYNAIAPLLRGRHLTEWSESTGPSRSVVVIDEIDKATKDFPNDLLHEIEMMSFRIKEFPGSPTPATPLLDDIPKSLRPVVVITSNEERQLPDAFLRRCVFHEIAFPEPKKLKLIVQAGLANRLLRMGWKGKEVPALSRDTTDRLIALLVDFRKSDPDKKPGIAEMLDAAALLFMSGDVELSILRPALVKLKRDGALFQNALSGKRQEP
jgi:MoxR-like ATPase